MALNKPKPPPKKGGPTKQKLSGWKKSYDKKVSQPKKLPQGPGKGEHLARDTHPSKAAKKAAADKAKKGSPNWRDSTYLKQESYLKKLLADFNAKQIRSKADLAVYYGNEERAGTAEVRDKDTVTKVPIKEAAKKQTSSVNSSIDAMNKNKKKPSPTPKKSSGIPLRRPNPPKGKTQLARDEHPNMGHGKTKLAPDTHPYKPKKTTKYKTVVTKGKVIRQATAGTHASEGLYQKELADARVKDKADITDDYAARGVLHSGLYAQKQGDYETEYGKQVAETNRQKASKYADLAEENRDFLNDQEMQKEQARLDAVRRKAAKTGKVV